jgi:hypothetical protein
MKDLVRILKEYCDLKGFEFVTGNKAVQNLFQPNQILNPNKIYLFLDPVTRKSERTISGSVKGKVFTGNFGLLVKSSLDMPYFEEVNNSELISKYTMNIEPLFTETELMQKDLGCQNLEVLDWSEIDIKDFLDANFDGVIVTYQIRSYAN